MIFILWVEKHKTVPVLKFLLFPLFLGVDVIVVGFTVTLHLRTLLCHCQNGGVSAKLSIPGSLVSGLSGADGVFACPP